MVLVMCCGLNRHSWADFLAWIDINWRLMSVNKSVRMRMHSSC